jgi:Helix-turn-helix domain
MASERFFTPTQFTPEQRAEHQAIRERFKHRPSIQELLETGEIDPPVPASVHHDLTRMAATLKAMREAAGMSVEDAARASGFGATVDTIHDIDRGAFSGDAISAMFRLASALGWRVSVRMESEPVPAANGTVASAPR